MGVSGHGREALPFDPQTLDYYERDAETYGAHRGPVEFPALLNFMKSLPTRAAVLELGCGGGQDAEVLLREGFDVTVTDGSPAMADFAARRLGRSVSVLQFDQLEYVRAFDGVLDLILGFFDRATSEVRIHSSTKSTREVFSNVNALLGQ